MTSEALKAFQAEIAANRARNEADGFVEGQPPPREVLAGEEEDGGGDEFSAKRQIKALTLWQPWATLIALGIKTVETRKWKTPYRGPLAIHAAYRRPRPDDWGDAEQQELMLRTLWERRVNWTDMPRKAIVAVCELVDVLPTSELEPDPWGDYRAGRYGWILEEIRPLDKPIVIGGARSLWDVSKAHFTIEI